MPNLTNMPNQKLFMATTSKKCQISEIWHKNMPVGNTGSTCSPRLSWLLGINKLVSVTVGRCNKKKATATVATVVLALKKCSQAQRRR